MSDELVLKKTCEISRNKCVSTGLDLYGRFIKIIIEDKKIGVGLIFNREEWDKIIINNKLNIVDFYGVQYIRCSDKNRNIIYLNDEEWLMLVNSKSLIDSYMRLLDKWSFPFEQIINNFSNVIKNTPHEKLGELLTPENVLKFDICNTHSIFFFWEIKSHMLKTLLKEA